MVMLLDDMRAPARNARCSKNRCIQRWIESEHGENRRSIKIDISAEMFLVFHRLLELLANRDPILFPRALAQIAPDLAHDLHTRIPLFVNAVAETHDFRLGCEFLF